MRGPGTTPGLNHGAGIRGKRVKLRSMKATKRCGTCKKEKPNVEFYVHARGLSGNCKECQRAWARAYKAAHAQPAKPRNTLSPIGRAAYYLWNNAKKRAGYRNLPFDIRRDDIARLVEDFCASHFYSLDLRSPFRPSIDRIDKSKGYTRDNVRIVWLIENLCRNTFTDNEVLEFCKRKLEIMNQQKGA